MLTPPYPAHPSAEDWRDAIARMSGGPPFGTSRMVSDPLGYMWMLARDRMQTRHHRSPAYAAYREYCTAQAKAAADVAEAARQRRDRAKTAKQWAEEFAHYEDGGTAETWEALQLENAEAAKVKAIRREAMSPRRKRFTAA